MAKPVTADVPQQTLADRLGRMPTREEVRAEHQLPPPPAETAPEPEPVDVPTDDDAPDKESDG